MSIFPLAGKPLVAAISGFYHRLSLHWGEGLESLIVLFQSLCILFIFCACIFVCGKIFHNRKYCRDYTSGTALVTVHYLSLLHQLLYIQINDYNPTVISPWYLNNTCINDIKKDNNKYLT